MKSLDCIRMVSDQICAILNPPISGHAFLDKTPVLVARWQIDPRNPGVLDQPGALTVVPADDDHLVRPGICDAQLVPPYLVVDATCIGLKLLRHDEARRDGTVGAERRFNPFR